MNRSWGFKKDQVLKRLTFPVSSMQKDPMELMLEHTSTGIYILQLQQQC
jgi:hypothetical protein